MPKKLFTVTNVNKALLVLFILSLVYCIYDLCAFVLPGITAITFEKAQNIQAADGRGSKKAQAQKPDSENIKPLSYYTERIVKKALFKAQAGSVISGEPKGSGQRLGSGIREAAEGLVLKGIIAGENPQAVIEDAKAQKTYFVLKNDRIGDIIVEEIANNKVKLSLNSETTELAL